MPKNVNFATASQRVVRNAYGSTERASWNLQNQVTRDQRSLESFELYQRIWNQNVERYEKARGKLNRGHHKNRAANKQQSLNGPDITL